MSSIPRPRIHGLLTYAIKFIVYYFVQTRKLLVEQPIAAVFVLLTACYNLLISLPNPQASCLTAKQYYC
ncbi:hypothetical protein V8F33_005835 [Rhypophila sp. PSN 637]